MSPTMDTVRDCADRSAHDGTRAILRSTLDRLCAENRANQYRRSFRHHHHVELCIRLLSRHGADRHGQEGAVGQSQVRAVYRCQHDNRHVSGVWMRESGRIF